MPNHVENYITIRGSKQRIDELREAVKNDEFGVGTIDFEKLISRPKELEITSGSDQTKGLKAYQDFIDVYTFANGGKELDLLNIPEEKEKIFLRQRTDITEKQWELGKQAYRNIQLHGAPTWYEWSCDNWGTKWNAYGYNQGVDYTDVDGIYCQTAWSAPHGAIERLAQLYPDLEFTHEWADEDISNNCGRAEYAHGVKQSVYYPEPGTREAFEFSARIWDMDLNDAGLYLNATETGYIYAGEREFELVHFMDQPALFTNERITEADIPKGLFVYYLRHSDNGCNFSSVEPKVAVNFAGSVILNEPLYFGGKDHISLTEDTSPNFLGESEMSLQDFLEGRFEQDESEGQTGGMDLS